MANDTENDFFRFIIPPTPLDLLNSVQKTAPKAGNVGTQLLDRNYLFLIC